MQGAPRRSCLEGAHGARGLGDYLWGKGRISFSGSGVLLDVGEGLVPGWTVLSTAPVAMQKASGSLGGPDTSQELRNGVWANTTRPFEGQGPLNSGSCCTELHGHWLSPHLLPFPGPALVGEKMRQPSV